MESKGLTSNIARIIKTARRDRRLSQSKLAGRLDITQARYSQIENEKGSFSAEQLITLVRFFNIPLSAFETSKKKSSEDRELQNAVAYFGGKNLYESSDLLPSEKFDRLNSVVVETIIIGSPTRLLTSLAAVIVKNINNVDFNWIESRLFQRSYLNRWGWFLENTFEALKIFSRYNKKMHGTAYYKLSRGLDLLKFEWEIGKNTFKETVLDNNILSEKTERLVMAKRSDISKKWKIVSRLQLEDFKIALDEALI